MKPHYAAYLWLLMFASHFALGQNGAWGSWNIVNLKLNLNKQWAVFSESELRSQHFYADFSYYELKGGASYNLKKNLSVLLGGGRFMTYSDNNNFKLPFINEEWRIWEQFAINNYIGSIKLENRVRVEQRWTTSLGYKNRLEYRLNVLRPLGSKRITPGTFYLNGWDEIYLSNTGPHYEQNKAFGGMGYEVSSSLTIQTGFIHQISYKPDESHTGKNYIRLTFLVEQNAHRRHHDKIGSNPD